MNRPFQPAERIALARLVVRNEFAIVAVDLRGEPGRQRIRVEDLRTEAAIELDALELESLAWASHRDLVALLDPSLTRWPSEDADDARLGELGQSLPIS